MNHIKAVIFDMDGVIVDTEPIYYDKRKQFLTDSNITVPDEILVKTVGGNKAEIWKILKDYVTKVMDEKTYHDRLMNYYNQVNIDYSAIEMPNIRYLLDYLKENGYKLGLASSTNIELVNKVINELKINEYFETIISGDEFKRSKPDPEIYQVSARKLGVNTDECLVVEDSNMGITAAKAAGMIVVARKNHYFNIDQRAANYIVDDLIKVKDIIEQINKS